MKHGRRRYGRRIALHLRAYIRLVVSCVGIKKRISVFCCTFPLGRAVYILGKLRKLGVDTGKGGAHKNEAKRLLYLFIVDFLHEGVTGIKMDGGM